MNELQQAQDVIREALFVHELLVRFGFPEKSIQLLLGITSTPDHALFHERTKMSDVCLFVTLTSVADGEAKTWRLCVGPVPTDGVTFTREINRFVKAGPLSHREWEQSRARATAGSIGRSIVARGILLPKGGQPDVPEVWT